MAIVSVFTPAEKEFITSLFREYILRHTIEARCAHISGNMTAAELKWHLEHAEWARSVFDKFGLKYE